MPSDYADSTDSKCREESAKLLGCLIRNCERLILPYIAPIHKVHDLFVKVCTCFIDLRPCLFGSTLISGTCGKTV